MKFFNYSSPLLIDVPHRKSISSLLFYLSFFIFTATTVFRETSLHYDYKTLYTLLIKIGWGVAYLSVLNALFFCQYRIWQLFLLLAVGVTLYISYMNSGNYQIYQSFLIIISARHIQWKKFIAACCIFYAFVLMSIFFCYHFGLLHSMYKFMRGTHIRFDMGFTHPNLFGSYLMVFCFLWMSMRYEKFRFFDYLIIFAIAIFSWIAPNSRTVAVILILLLITVFIMKHFGDILIKNRVSQAMFIMIFPLCFLLSWAGSYYYDDSKAFFVLLNKILTRRIAHAHSFLDNYPVTWMGQKLPLVSSLKSVLTGKPSSILDNSYIRLYLNMGVVTTVIILLMLTSIVWYAVRTNNQSLLIFLGLFAIYGLSEFRIAKVNANVALIAFTHLFSLYDSYYKKKRRAKRRRRYSSSTPT